MKVRQAVGSWMVGVGMWVSGLGWSESPREIPSKSEPEESRMDTSTPEILRRLIYDRGDDGEAELRALGFSPQSPEVQRMDSKASLARLSRIEPLLPALYLLVDTLTYRLRNHPFLAEMLREDQDHWLDQYRLHTLQDVTSIMSSLVDWELASLGPDVIIGIER